MLKKGFKFIDLFSGIGGFHQAMESFGGECVFASDINKECIKVYNKNYNFNSDFDITKVDAKDIPEHDVLCGGFPCQAFSKAGKQMGINDTRGTLFFDIARILKEHHTKYILLENVRNLVSHDNGNTWKTIKDTLHSLGYRLTKEPIVLSPHQFGVPQLRERVYIPGIYDPENVDKDLDISFDNLMKKEQNDLYSVLDSGKVEEKYYIDEYENIVLTAWDEFYKGIKEKVIGFPIWAQYFKVKKIDNKLPKWKYDFIDKNRKLYLNNKEFIDEWLKKYNNLKSFVPTHTKMEWQAGESIDTIWEGVIQFRPSGVRVKTPTVFPALVAMVQIPVIGKYKRRLTVRECARLQSFPENFICDEIDQQAYKQFGNSVNVEVLKQIFEKLIKIED